MSSNQSSDDKYIQENRQLKVFTALDESELLLQSFTGHESMSQLFSFQLEMVTQNFNIDFNKLVGQPIAFSVQFEEQEEARFFHGIVSRFSQLPEEKRFARYQAQVVPWLWFLTRTANCRIFQNKSVPDIVQEIFSDHGFQDFELQLQGSYDPWEYCVQYRETACNFVMRLLEQEGIFFFFRHEEEKHVMILCDDPSMYKPCPGQSRVRYDPNEVTSEGDFDEVITAWQVEEEFRPGKYTLNDFNFETPTTSLVSSIQGIVSQSGNSDYEVFDYPGEYETKGDGEKYARKRIEEEESPHRVVSGASNCRSLATGFKIDVADLRRRDQNGSYAITSVSHSARLLGFETSEENEAHYDNYFKGIPASVKFRPPRVTPKPVVQGCQTAIVTGPSGEEIYADKYGRVKVQFHWDREGKYDEEASCWVRVSQNWAGKKWGMMFLPRIGQEVIVDFLEGDPDRPIIVGRVYNASSMPAYNLPDEKTKSYIKSYSSMGGGGYNEIRFEDKKGEEQIFIHAQKNYDVRVENDLAQTITNDSHLKVQNDKYEQVTGDQHLEINGDQIEKIDGSLSIKVGADEQIKIAQKLAVDTGTEIHLKAGLKCIIEAGTQISLKVGGNFVDIGPSGVTIVGTMVLINSGGAPGSGSGSSPASPTAPKDADNAESGEAEDQQNEKAPMNKSSYSPLALKMKGAAGSGMPLVDTTE